MEKLSMCRICLTNDSELRLIVNTYFQEMYETLTLTPFVAEDIRPIQVCNLCCAKLDICYELRRSCLQSETMFTQLLRCNAQVKLQILPNTHQSLGDVEQMTPEVLDDEVKQEIAEDSEDETELCSIIKVEDDGIQTFEQDPFQDGDIKLAAPEGDFSYAVVKIEECDVTASAPVPKKPALTQDNHEDQIEQPNIKTERTVLDEPAQNNKEDKPFNCNICKESFIRKYDLVMHMRTHTGVKPYKCNICKKRFSKQNNLVNHFLTHTGEKPYICNICKKSFEHQKHLVMRIRSHTCEKLHICYICNKSFIRKNGLVMHIRTHTGEKPYNCNICRKSLSTKQSLVMHIRTHTGEKPYNCNICKKSFRHQNYLVTHIRTHTGEKPHKCNICRKSFSQKHSLVTHIRTHTGEKPYNCNICRKSFSQKQSLVIHIRTHTGEKPYSCNICERGFIRKSLLTSHIHFHTYENS